MYCKNCGNPLSDESNFCKKCGTKVEIKDENSDFEDILNSVNADNTDGTIVNTVESSTESNSEVTVASSVVIDNNEAGEISSSNEGILVVKTDTPIEENVSTAENTAIKEELPVLNENNNTSNVSSLATNSDNNISSDKANKPSKFIYVFCFIVCILLFASLYFNIQGFTEENDSEIERCITNNKSVESLEKTDIINIGKYKFKNSTNYKVSVNDKYAELAFNDNKILFYYSTFYNYEELKKNIWDKNSKLYTEFNIVDVSTKNIDSNEVLVITSKDNNQVDYSIMFVEKDSSTLMFAFEKNDKFDEMTRYITDISNNLSLNNEVNVINLYKK